MNKTKPLMVYLALFIAGAGLGMMAEDGFGKLVRYFYTSLTYHKIIFGLPGFDFPLPDARFMISSGFYIIIQYYFLWKQAPKQRLVSSFLSLMFLAAALLLFCYFDGTIKLMECTACNDGLRNLSYSDLNYNGILIFSLLMSCIPGLWTFIKQKTRKRNVSSAGNNFHARPVILFFMLCQVISGQSYDDFKADFKSALKSSFSEDELNNMFRTHSYFLTAHSDVTRLSYNIKGQEISPYPLSDFKNDKLYTDNINNLLNSKNANQRLLACLVIAGAGDRSFENELLKKIKTEKDKGCLIWAGMGLMYLNTSHTTPLFDFLVKNEDFGDAHMLPLFVSLNKDSLQQTAYARINSKEQVARILAVQILSRTQLNQETEQLLKKAVKEWDMDLKGYAIYSVKELRIGNLLETLKPLLENKATRRISLEALANSPTESDRQYVIGLTDRKDTVPEELLDCLYESKNPENTRYWLKLLYTKAIPAKYYFSVKDKETLVCSDSLLGDVQAALQKIKDPSVLKKLVTALQGRTDPESTRLLISFLTNNDPHVRYWAGHSLKGNRSAGLKAVLPGLLSNRMLREGSFTELAIENQLDTLQPLFEGIYNQALKEDLDWRRSSVEYLATFPKEQYKELFRKILQDKEEDTFMKREAALGLGRLKDESSVDLIIAVSRHEGERSDYNVQTFLSALGMIKGEKAKAEIERYRSSKEEQVRTLAAEILKTW